MVVTDVLVLSNTARDGGLRLAYLEGFRHGVQGVVTRGVCVLLQGSAERQEWMRGFTEGEAVAWAKCQSASIM